MKYLSYNNPWTNFASLQTALDLAWYYLGELLFYFTLQRRTSVIRWTMETAQGPDMTNHCLISSRGCTLFPDNFLVLRIAANVAGSYNYRPSSMQWLIIGMFAMVLLTLSFLPSEKKRPLPWRLFAPVAGATAICLGVFFGTGFMKNRGIEPSVWTTRDSGLFLNFPVRLKYTRVERLETYSEEALVALVGNALNNLAAVSATGEDNMIRPVNVVVIMNESLSDLSVLPGVGSNTDAMPFLRSLTENIIGGYAYSSVFGGTTANSEYEFLTSNITAFPFAGMMPHQMYVSDDDPTLVGWTAALGYCTVIAHPYRSSGQNRPSTYRDFGFDEVCFERDFQDREYMQGDEKTGYVTNRCNYENLIHQYEGKEAREPLFLFNVTIQNHSACQMTWTDLPREMRLTRALEDRFNTINRYLSLVYQSDQAFEYPLDHLSQVEEPTPILLSGGHQPQVATNFYTDVLETAPDITLTQRKQTVPFVLWVNCDIPEAQGVELSLNYLSALSADTVNLPMTRCQKYLVRLWGVALAINTVGTQDVDGNRYGKNEALPEELGAAVEDCWVLLYNHVFDKKGRVGGFFALAE